MHEISALLRLIYYNFATTSSHLFLLFTSILLLIRLLRDPHYYPRGPSYYLLPWDDCLDCLALVSYLRNLVRSATFGPKLGMRSMVQCRFSWGWVTIFHLPQVQLTDSKKFVQNLMIGSPEVILLLSFRLYSTSFLCKDTSPWIPLSEGKR